MEIGRVFLIIKQQTKTARTETKKNVTGGTIVDLKKKKEWKQDTRQGEREGQMEGIKDIRQERTKLIERCETLYIRDRGKT